MNRKEQFMLGTLIAYMQMILSRTALRSLRQSLYMHKNVPIIVKWKYYMIK